MEPGSSRGKPQQTEATTMEDEDYSGPNAETDSILPGDVERSEGGTQFRKKKSSRMTSSFRGLGKILSLGKIKSIGPERDEDPHLETLEEFELQPVTESSDPPQLEAINSRIMRPGTSTVTTSEGPTMSEEKGTGTNNGTCLSALWRKLYGQESIWHLILRGPPDGDEEEYPVSDILCALVLIAALVVVSVYVTRSQAKAPWPQDSHTYTTDDPTKNIQDGVTYTCGCILPPSLQSPETQTDEINLNVCYQPSSLESVTILMYSNSTAEAIISQVIQDNTDELPIEITVNSGWNVMLEAHELTVQYPGFNNIPNVTQLYPGGERQQTAHASVHNLLQDFNFPSSFPGAYVQMNWAYDCNNCSTCNLEAVNNLSRAAANESWVSCYYYGSDSHCTTLNNYTGKCVLYPPQTLPAQFAVQRFLQKFVNLSGINNIRPWDNTSLANYAELQPDVLYLTSSTVTSSPIRLGFLEVPKGSAVWAILLLYFPTLETECSVLPPTQVCNNQTALCNLFATGGSYSSYLCSCLPYTSHNQCQPLVTQATPDNEHLNTTNKGEAFAEIVCPQNITCWNEAPYLVTWNTPQSGSNDALNSFLAPGGLFNEWEQISGVCTKTYRSVIRHPPTPDNEKEMIFLESECSNASVSQPSFCWTTGVYHNLSDLPNNSWSQLPDDLWKPNPDRFVCYRIERQKLKDLLINNFGVLFGWIGTVVLVFYALFSVWVLVRRRIFRISRRVSAAVGVR
ncbi:unnamed protein product [Calypogeia fissa]